MYYKNVIQRDNELMINRQICKFTKKNKKYLEITNISIDNIKNIK